MSTFYWIYTEAKLDGIWHCIDGYYLNKGEYRLCETYSTSGRSFVGDFFDKLLEIGNSISWSDISEEIKKTHANLDMPDGFLAVNYTDFARIVPKTPEHHGIVHKDAVWAFEHGDVEDIYHLEDKDLFKMSTLPECYQYYEWDDPYGWAVHFRDIDRNVSAVIDRYAYHDMRMEDADIRLIVVKV